MENLIEQMSAKAKEIIKGTVDLQVKSDGQEVIERITPLDLEEY